MRCSQAASAVRAQTLEIKGMDPMSLAVAACDFDSNGVPETRNRG